jgi:hypothetical protein
LGFSYFPDAATWLAGWLHGSIIHVYPPGGWCSPRTDRAEPPTARGRSCGSVENDGGNQHSISLPPGLVHCGAPERPILSAFDADLLPFLGRSAGIFGRFQGHGCALGTSGIASTREAGAERHGRRRLDGSMLRTDRRW